jgi:hypothetical protein
MLEIKVTCPRSATFTVALHAPTATSKIRRCEDPKKARKNPEKKVPRKRSDEIRDRSRAGGPQAGARQPAA